MSTKKTSSKKKKYPKVVEGIIHLNSSSNNTIITFTDQLGNKIFGGGTGMAGFKGTKESSAYAAEILAKQIVKDAKDNCGLKEIGVICKGTGLGRDGLFRAVNEVGGVDIKFIKDTTPIQFGGTKGKRPKRN